MNFASVTFELHERGNVTRHLLLFVIEKVTIIGNIPPPLLARDFERGDTQKVESVRCHTLTFSFYYFYFFVPSIL